jgi:hypothetical protein
MMDKYTTTKQIASIEYQVRELTMTDIRQWLRDIELAAANSVAVAPIRWWKSFWRSLLTSVGLETKPAPAAKRDAVDLMLFEGLVMYDLRFLTNLTEAQIAQLTPRQIREVWAACEEVNEDFFQFRGRLETVGMASPQIFAGS